MLNNFSRKFPKQLTTFIRDEIRSIFFTRQLVYELRGSDLKVRSLKQELERKLELMKPPVVVIQWPNREIRLSHLYGVSR